MEINVLFKKIRCVREREDSGREKVRNKIHDWLLSTIYTAFLGFRKKHIKTFSIFKIFSDWLAREMIIYDETLSSLKLCPVYRNDKSMKSQYIKLSYSETWGKYSRPSSSHQSISDFNFHRVSGKSFSFAMREKNKFEGMCMDGD